MRIADLKRRRQKRATKNKRLAPKDMALFTNRLSAAEHYQNDIVFSELWDAVTKAEARVRRSLAFPDWVSYRNVICDFLHFVLDSGYKTLDRTGFSPHGEHYAHTVVSAINKKIHEVGITFLQDSQDRLTLLAQLDELRGMLLDLYA